MSQQQLRRIIYLAEDDQDDSILFQEALLELDASITVKISQDGQQLLENLNKDLLQKPEIIFLDINMPCKNGFECLKEIRSIRDFNAIKIIMFSTSSSILHMELSYKLGADHYAVKPGSFQELKELLGMILVMDLGTAKKNKETFVLSTAKKNIL